MNYNQSGPNCENHLIDPRGADPKRHRMTEWPELWDHLIDPRGEDPIITLREHLFEFKII